MKIIATGDLHYGLRKEGDRSTEEVAEKVNTSDAHVFIIAGDIADRTENLEKCLNLFKAFRGYKLLVAGNHDIWSTIGDSFNIYTEKLWKISEDYGFHYLDNSPFVLEKTGFVGNIGWYDYSFKLEELNIPVKYYEEKRFPKVAAWNDRKYIKWNYSDCDFLNNILEKMRTHIESIHNRVEKIICITHHLPFKNMTVKTNHLPWDFAQAYLGSVKIGELFLNYKKIKLSICAHSHREKIIEEGHVKCINVGSTYASKKLLTLDF